MTNLKIRFRIFHFFMLFVCPAFLMPCKAQNQICWTTVGATGIADQKSRDVIKLGEKIGRRAVVDINQSGGTEIDLTTIKSYGGVAYLLAGSKKGVYHIRYPINQLYTEPGYNIVELKARYKVANKDKERIVINLNRYSLNAPNISEGIETIMRFDSESFASNYHFQIQSIGTANVFFNFKEYGYFIDAQLINKSSPPPQPQQVGNLGAALGLVQLCTSYQFD